ncbi:hypothetical protein T08_5515 [Trichinella sp. T8]|nr:hypothetical protein T08_5515 [Trichinella sp. T8]
MMPFCSYYTRVSVICFLYCAPTLVQLCKMCSLWLAIHYISVIWPLVKQRIEFYSPKSSMTQK